MIHIVYMAAGNSRRFGNKNKLLQNWNGKPLYLHTFEKLLRIREKEPEKVSLTVVTQFPEIYQEVKKYSGVHAVFCEESRLGVSYTIKAGIRSVQEIRTWDYLMFAVADQPNLSEQSIEALIRAADPRFMQTYSLRCGDRVGNPCMFRADLIPELMQLEGDKGGRAVLKKHECCYVEIEDEGEFSDIDTEEQIRRTKCEV